MIVMGAGVCSEISLPVVMTPDNNKSDKLQDKVSNAMNLVMKWRKP